MTEPLIASKLRGPWLADSRLWFEWCVLALISFAFPFSFGFFRSFADELGIGFLFHALFWTLIYVSSWLLVYARWPLFLVTAMLAGYCYLYGFIGIQGLEFYYDLMDQRRPMLHGIEYAILAGVGGGGFVGWSIVEALIRSFGRSKLVCRRGETLVTLTRPWSIMDLLSLITIVAIVLSLILGKDRNEDSSRNILMVCYAIFFGLMVLFPIFLGFHFSLAVSGSRKRNVFGVLLLIMGIGSVVIASLRQELSWVLFPWVCAVGMLYGWRIKRLNYSLYNASRLAASHLSESTRPSAMIESE